MENQNLTSGLGVTYKNETDISPLGKKLLEKSGTIQINPEKNGHIWQTTMNLRWVNRREYLTRIDRFGNNECYGEKFVNVLQQEFKTEEYQSEWRDIPFVVL